MKICPRCNSNEITYRNPNTGVYAPYCGQCRKEFDAAYARSNKRKVSLSRYNNKPERKQHMREYSRAAGYSESRKRADAAWRSRNPDSPKLKARKAAWYAKSKGRLVPQPCEVCGTMFELCMHHDDYSKPLDVRWFCRKHHNHVHGNLLDE